MIAWLSENLTLLMFVTMFVVIFCGYPVAFVLGATGFSLIFLLGFPFEWIEICLIVLPIFAPILARMDFSSHIGNNAWFMPWFATLVAVNLQTSFMSPPFGATLFHMKGTVPPDCSMTDVHRGVYPFLALQVIGLFL